MKRFKAHHYIRPLTGPKTIYPTRTAGLAALQPSEVLYFQVSPGYAETVTSPGGGLLSVEHRRPDPYSDMGRWEPAKR